MQCVPDEANDESWSLGEDEEEREGRGARELKQRRAIFFELKDLAFRHSFEVWFLDKPFPFSLCLLNQRIGFDPDQSGLQFGLDSNFAIL